MTEARVAAASINNQYAISPKLVDEYSRYIDSPVLRLKFLNSMMTQRYQPQGWLPRVMRRAPGLGSLPERAALILALSKVLPVGGSLPLSFKVTFVLYRLRMVLFAGSLIVLLAGAFAGARAGIHLVRRNRAASQPLASASTNQDGQGVVGISEVLQGAAALAAVGSKAGLPLSKVWLAEQGDGYEFYSNGARILTEFQTVGRVRRFYQFPVGDSSGSVLQPVLASKPVGIVFHVSESDLVPFAGSNNTSLNGASRAFLDFAKEHRLYNYCIDRFGRIYRIVADEYVSNHAGNSTWGDGKNMYVNLNSSFIGICFEGKSKSGSAVGPDGINEAQIYAARVLTAVVRSKYDIADADCVTHGLVSVNPSNHLMGYHTDWAAGFPFEAIGLTDKYNIEMVAISSFGFTYDQNYVTSAGGHRWPGLDLADTNLKEAAKKKGINVESERNLRWQTFQRAYSMQRALDKQSGDES